ncbi:chemoreceptor glutamine deamidase CheD [Dactylosporangium fulvum]|uniref:Probable chemoreceptor glutamine deamidase CheD n=1 Tax=Dactylosporangium fulvum TaxID=53359 RepID=A0ABY5W857_9ACTN|nr:chemotaxis protein CheD [Dactylosporangium fulvum]UWP86230.1 chemotaxis protein CheD [Dactylosporangium fulvum]
MTSPRTVFLKPGEFHFAGPGTRIATLLGSCVAVSLWHPRLRIGGMCHYMLPHHGRPAQVRALDGRYATDAFELFRRELERTGTRPAEYEAKLFGGGAQVLRDGVARANVAAGLSLLDRHGFTVVARHLGGTGARRLRFDLATGDVWMYHNDRSPLDEAS